MSDKFEDYTTDQLLAAVGKRFDAFVFVGCQTKTKAAQDLTFASTGPFHAVMGLVATAEMLVKAGGVGEE